MNPLAYTLRSMQHRSLRAWLTLIGIIIGVATIVGLMALSQGMQNAIEDLLLGFGAQNIRVIPGGANGPPVGLSGLTDKDVGTIDGVRGVAYAAGALGQIGEVEYNGEKSYRTIMAVESRQAEQLFIDLNLDFADGRPPKSGENHVVVIGDQLANRVFDKEIRVRNKISVQGEDFKVIGIFASTGSEQTDGIMYLPLDTARVLFDKQDSLNAIIVHVAEGQDVAEVAGRIEKRLNATRSDRNFQVFTPEQLIRRIQGVLGMIGIVLAGIGMISIVVGGIGIMNAMFTSVLERTREIGVMKAIGASNSRILMMFLLESAGIGMLGGTIGVICGFGMAFAIAGIAKAAGFGLLLIRPTLGLTLFGLFFAAFIGIGAGLLPAFVASRTVPVESLRYE